MKQNLALFDLDNTLLAGDSDYNWSLFLINQGLLDAKTHHERNEQFYLDYKNGHLDIYKFLELYIWGELGSEPDNFVAPPFDKFYQSFQLL